MSAKYLRRYLSAAHLYLGLVLGGAFALLGVTGSLLVFYPELDRFLNPELRISSRPLPELNVQHMFERLHEAFPQRQGVWRLELPRASGQAVFARYVTPEEKSPELFAPLVVALDPATGTVINSRFWGDYAVTWVYNLHYSLLSGKTGTVLVSLLGIAFLISVCIGFYIWLPRGRNRLTKALPKIRSGSRKAVYDLHGYFGAYAFGLLLLLIITGVGLATPQWLEPFVYCISSKTPDFKVESIVPLGAAFRIDANQAIAVSLNKFSGSQVRWIEAPSTAEGVYVVRLKQAGEPSDRFPKTYVRVDQFSSQVLSVRDALKVSAGDVFFDWLHPLHNGEALGLWGRWLVFILGLVPGFLWCTGLIRWRHKIIAKNR